jgi:hypothetical protein
MDKDAAQGMKVRGQDLTDAIYTMDRDKAKSTESKVIVYTMSGRGDLKKDNNDVITNVVRTTASDRKVSVLAEERVEAYAKESWVAGKVRYYIKTGRDGKLFNPLSLLPADTKKYIVTHGKSEWVYREVNKKVFDFYLNYLRTKNTSWLLNAERENI